MTRVGRFIAALWTSAASYQRTWLIAICACGFFVALYIIGWLFGRYI